MDEQELNKSNKPDKSAHALREEKTLAFWKEKEIFEKSLDKEAPKGGFVFYEGPPTANGHPGIHHLEARAFKDAIPRYKTMQGYYVRRKGGWDTHGLPVELQVEKELGLKSKKEIDKYGIAAFNEKCKESVWKYVHEWEEFTDRIGYWVDLKNPYVTYESSYVESVWNIVKTIEEKGLLYKDYKVVPWCPRCGTALSSHELAQGYEVVKDLAMTVKFELVDESKTHLLAWTTTPWTLPGNVGLAVNPKLEYVKIKIENSFYILAKSRLSILKEIQYIIIESMEGSKLIGISYKPPYSFLRDNISDKEKDKFENAFKVYAADFVTTEDGTGIVHTAVMYGQDDFELGTKVGLPKHHLVNEDGTFKKETGFLAGAFVKDPNTDVAIIKDLASRDLLFAKEKYEHSYPFCWRCKTPLIYFARDSWYIEMSALRDKLVKENKDIHWEPEHIKEGRFGEWLREVKDWAVSRERYWGTPLPVWLCESCKKRKVIGSVAEIMQQPKNTYYVMRHGEAENNTLGILSSDVNAPHHLTEKGRLQVNQMIDTVKKLSVNVIVASPFVRTRETAEIIRTSIGFSEGIIIDDRLCELNVGSWSGKSLREYLDFVKHFRHSEERFEKGPDGGENFSDVKKRTGECIYDLEHKYQGKKILIVTHELPALLLVAAARGLDRRESIDLRGTGEFLNNAEIKEINFSILPHNAEYELDLHRPFIDDVKLACDCGGTMNRVKEVMDCWFDSGAMPFAQDHYPFGFKKHGFFRKDGLLYPADYISEAIDQTRGWFYTLHAIGVLMNKGKAYKNVICLGHILDAEGKKMSKSLGNVVDPWEMMDKYGADALRFWMYSVNQSGDSKNFDEKTVDEVVKKVFNLATNVLAFYQLYVEGMGSTSSSSLVEKAPPTSPTTFPRDESLHAVKSRGNVVGEVGETVPVKDRVISTSSNILDQWIVTRLNQLIATVTHGLDAYLFMEPTRTIRDFVADLSQWYLRRSRDRFKEEGEDKRNVLTTTRYVLLTLAKIMAPFTPFFAEYIYQSVEGEIESVHLEDWPAGGAVDSKLLENMKIVRNISSKGLEARMLAKINVRQPLKELKVKGDVARVGLAKEFIDLIKDEVNVKEVIFDTTIAKDVELDLVMTPELKEEGEVRELLRKIQDLRKEKGLVVGDVAILVVTDDLKDLVLKHMGVIKKNTNLKSIEFGDKFELKF